MTDTLIHEIMGKRYILVDIPHIEGYGKKCREFIATHGLLYQGVRIIERGGLFSKAVIVQTYFCPEENFIAFAKDQIG